MQTAAQTSLALLIADRATHSADHHYLEDARSTRSLSYVDFGTLVAGWRSHLDTLAVPAEALVMVDLDDPLAFAVAHLSVIASGRRSIPVDPGTSISDIDRLVSTVGDVALIISDRDHSSLTTLRVDAATLRPADAAATLETAVTAPPNEGAALLYTSGSTGTPKGVELTERQLLFVAAAIADHNGLTANDRGYNPLPLFHVNAEVVGLLSTLTAGATLVLDRRFHRTGFWALVAEREITWINAVPAILALLARGDQNATEQPAIPAGLRFIRSASAPLPDAVREAYEGVPIVVSWGMTEGASQITATPLDAPPRAGSVGVPVGGEVQVRSPEGEVLAHDEIGALWVRGPGIVSSYFRGSAPERFDSDGWLATGDLGKIDSDGWVSLVGRSDDVINRGGEKVYPAEVEDVLLEEPRVREAIVVARAHPILGFVPVAYVIATDDAAASDSLITDLTARCEAELPRFKRPIEIVVVDDVPRAATGKVKRGGLRDLDSERVASSA